MQAHPYSSVSILRNKEQTQTTSNINKFLRKVQAELIKNNTMKHTQNKRKSRSKAKR
jgi:hypothetical protein